MITSAETLAAPPEADHSPAEHELHQHLSSLAVLHPATAADAFAAHDPSAGRYKDRTVNEIIPGYFKVEKAAGSDAYQPETGSAPDSKEKSRLLEAIRSVIATEASGQSDPAQPVDWGHISHALLERGIQAEADNRADLFVASIVSAQFASGRAIREGLLKTIYERNLQSEAAAACRNSHLVVLTAGPHSPMGPAHPNAVFEPTSIHPMHRYAPAFEIDPERLKKYLAHIPKGLPEGVPDQPGISLKKFQKELVAQSQAGEVDEALQRQAETASLKNEKIGETLLDMYKVERFALEQQFIHEQAKDVLAGPDWAHSALAKALERTRFTDNTVSATDQSNRVPTGPLGRAVSKLEADVIAVMRELSKPAIAKFSLEGVDLEDVANMTPEQRAALRFRTVLDYTEQHIALAQYLDYENFVERNESQIINQPETGLEIWTLSEDSAAAPSLAIEMIEQIMQYAYEPGAPQATEDELATLAQDNRRLLLGAATHSIEEVRPEATSRSKGITRNKSGELEIGLTVSVVPKGSLEVYSAVALGCPALREISNNRALMSFAEKAAYGSSNYIDHILAAVINEAQARGIFKPGQYPVEEPAPA